MALVLLAVLPGLKSVTFIYTSPITTTMNNKNNMEGAKMNMDARIYNVNFNLYEAEGFIIALSMAAEEFKGSGYEHRYINCLDMVSKAMSTAHQAERERQEAKVQGASANG